MMAPELREQQVAVADHRELAQRMHLDCVRRRKIGDRVACVRNDLVLQSKLFQQPEDALRAGVVEVMDDDHGACRTGR